MSPPEIAARRAAHERTRVPGSFGARDADVETGAHHPGHFGFVERTRCGRDAVVESRRYRRPHRIRVLWRRAGVSRVGRRSGPSVRVSCGRRIRLPRPAEFGEACGRYIQPLRQRSSIHVSPTTSPSSGAIRRWSRIGDVFENAVDTSSLTRSKHRAQRISPPAVRRNRPAARLARPLNFPRR